MFACSSLCLSRCCALVLDLCAVAVLHYAYAFLFPVAVVVCFRPMAICLYIGAAAAVYLYALVTWLCINCVPLWGLYTVAICYCMFAYSSLCLICCSTAAVFVC